MSSTRTAEEALDPAPLPAERPHWPAREVVYFVLSGFLAGLATALTLALVVLLVI